ncbi:YIP1 family protein [Desulfarculales bacterium]
MAAYCPFCGAEVAPAIAAPGGLPEAMRCPVCGQKQEHPAAPATSLPPQPPPVPPASPTLGGHQDWAWQEGPASPPSGGQGPAWEGEAGLLSRLWHTTWQMLGHPGRTLTPPPARHGMSWPLSYGLVLGTCSTAMTLLWGMLLDISPLSSKAALWLLFLAPLITLAEMFITTAVVHVMLFILGSAKQGFGATFRANAYGEAAGFLAILPYVGTPAVLIWHLVVLTAGLAATHGIGKGRAFFAIILPPLLLVVLAMLAVIALGLTALLAVVGEMGKSGGGWGL